MHNTTVVFSAPLQLLGKAPATSTWGHYLAIQGKRQVAKGNHLTVNPWNHMRFMQNPD